MCVVWIQRVRGSLLALVQHDVVAFIDTSPIYAVASQSADDHFGVLVAGEDRRGADDGPVYVALIVEDGAAAAASTDDVDGCIEAGFG